MLKPSTEVSHSTSAISEPTCSTTLAGTEPQGHTYASPTRNTEEQATIGKSLVIRGEVSGSESLSESLCIEGQVEGSINLPSSRVTIGRSGVVSANIAAREIVILGQVCGSMTASDRCDLRSEGSLTGDIVASRISIDDGAYFKGSIDIRGAGRNTTGNNA